MNTTKPEKKKQSNNFFMIWLIFIAVATNFSMDIMFSWVDQHEGRAERQATAARNYVHSLAQAKEPIQIVRLRTVGTCYIVAYQYHTRTSESASTAYLPKEDCAELQAKGAVVTEINDLPSK